MKFLNHNKKIINKKMEDKINNCSYKGHEKIEAIYYCLHCKIYLCNKCVLISKGE